MAIAAVAAQAARLLPAITSVMGGKEKSPGSPSTALGSQFQGVSGSVSLTGASKASTPSQGSTVPNAQMGHL